MPFPSRASPRQKKPSRLIDLPTHPVSLTIEFYHCQKQVILKITYIYNYIYIYIYTRKKKKHAMNFAPYQPSPPETQRQLSPPPSSVTASPRQSVDNNVGRRSFSPIQRLTPPPLQHPQPQRQWGAAAAAAQNLPLPTSFANFGGGGGGACGSDSGLVGGVSGYRDGVSEFDTSFGIRLDYEACLAYLAVPPLGAVFLLILERKSDYVRYVLLLFPHFPRVLSARKQAWQ